MHRNGNNSTNNLRSVSKFASKRLTMVHLIDSWAERRETIAELHTHSSSSTLHITIQMFSYHLWIRLSIPHYIPREMKLVLAETPGCSTKVKA
ncbi:hypothetical protein Agabi119p4_7794 [Agaricus bisporus var. burnettii]|uniref:Uncharacterized protein n=1 Tax=Agaricus bisporus var. burnettii TaxID=192524 RepID=A0A8H7C7X0_AGABI|nr:hypothetical protein Agabi119p4_7794 [Agaricus bisporus var. burnettii]